MTLAEERFWAKVDRSGGPDACWIWRAYRDKDGYGRFWKGGRNVFAHRFAWELEHSSIPSSLHACHRCDNPSCVNVAHLFLGTNAENVADRDAKGRQSRGEKHSACTKPEKRPRGERNGNAKLSAELVLKIRASNETNTAVAKRLGVTHRNVLYVRAGKRWAHVEVA